MSVTTSGIELQGRSRPLRDAVELVSSMRFSISLLTVICIASIIGTVVRQHEPYSNYVNQFGPFWAPLSSRMAHSMADIAEHSAHGPDDRSTRRRGVRPSIITTGDRP
jgi:hypothetical protein